MQIIFGQEIAEDLRARHVVLELETFMVDGVEKTAYCVVNAEKILNEMPDIERLCRLHQAVVDAIKRNDADTVLAGIEHLRGRFGGDVDSFYEVIFERFKREID